MNNKHNAQQAALKETEAFVRTSLEKSLKKKPSESTVRAVARKVAKAIPPRVLEHA